jgi:hypothetical protein
MKKYILLLLFLTVTFSFSQTIEFKNLNVGEYKTYISKNKLNYSIGNSIHFGYPYNKEIFSFITQGNSGVSIYFSNTKVTIDSIKVIKLQNGFLKCFLLIKGFGSTPVMVDVESAEETNEIK